MGRWTKGYAISDTFDAVDAHNADCDAYEARIAELEALVRRVKAESLRVVVDVEAAELDKIQRHQYVQWEGHVCVPDKLRVELVRITDNHRYDVRQQYCDSFRFSPVRLERWETEE